VDIRQEKKVKKLWGQGKKKAGQKGFVGTWRSISRGQNFGSSGGGEEKSGGVEEYETNLTEK